MNASYFKIRTKNLAKSVTRNFCVITIGYQKRKLLLYIKKATNTFCFTVFTTEVINETFN